MTVLEGDFGMRFGDWICGSLFLLGDGFADRYFYAELDFEIAAQFGMAFEIRCCLADRYFNLGSDSGIAAEGLGNAHNRPKPDSNPGPRGQESSAQPARPLLLAV